MATFHFSEKVAIITGANSGIGKSTAILFAKGGASLSICGRDEERLKAVFDQCVEASGGHADRFISLTGDLTDSTVRKSIVEKTIEKFGKLDILVANAAMILPNTDIFNATEDVFDRIMDTNVKSIFFLIQISLPFLEQSKGNIVCVSSLVSTTVFGRTVIYPMTKAAIDHMTRCLALDLAPKGIRVNAVNPSFVPTRLQRSFQTSDVDLEKVHELIGAMEIPNQPMNGQLISTQDVANNIAFLASDGARFVTGQCHIVDGGRQFLGACSFSKD